MITHKTKITNLRSFNEMEMYMYTVTMLFKVESCNNKI